MRVLLGVEETRRQREGEPLTRFRLGISHGALSSLYHAALN